jgi:hypothetical protein
MRSMIHMGAVVTVVAMAATVSACTPDRPSRDVLEASHACFQLHENDSLTETEKGTCVQVSRKLHGWLDTYFSTPTEDRDPDWGDIVCKRADLLDREFPASELQHDKRCDDVLNEKNRVILEKFKEKP